MGHAGHMTLTCLVTGARGRAGNVLGRDLRVTLARDERLGLRFSLGRSTVVTVLHCVGNDMGVLLVIVAAASTHQTDGSSIGGAVGGAETKIVVFQA